MPQKNDMKTEMQKDIDSGKMQSAYAKTAHTPTPICTLVECFCGKHPEIKPVGQYMIKCSECRCTMGYTDDVKESYQGGTCKECWINQGCKQPSITYTDG